MGRKARERRRVSAKKWREEIRGGSNYLRIPDEVGLFRPKAETYRLDFMPYVAGDGNPRAEKGEEYFERTFWVHQNVGVNQDWHLCAAKTFKRPCPICEHRAKLMADPDADEDVIKSLAPKERQLWLVRNTQEDPDALLLWEVSYHLFGRSLKDKINNADEEDGYDYFADPTDGYTVRVAFTQSERGKWLDVADIEFRKRAVSYDVEIAKEMPCLDDMLVETPYDKLKKIFLQTDDTDDEDHDDEPKETKPSVSRGSKKKVESKTGKRKQKEQEPRAANLSAGDMVSYEGEECEVLKVSGDGTSLILEAPDGTIHRAIGLDDLDSDSPAVSSGEPTASSKDQDDDDDWDFDDTDDASGNGDGPEKKFGSDVDDVVEDDGDDEDDEDWDFGDD